MGGHQIQDEAVDEFCHHRERHAQGFIVGFQLIKRIEYSHNTIAQPGGCGVSIWTGVFGRHDAPYTQSPGRMSRLFFMLGFVATGPLLLKALCARAMTFVQTR